MTFGPTTDLLGFRTLGRLLISGVVSGALIGATVGALLFFAPDDASAYWVGGLMLGASLGMVAGLVTQALTFAAVLVAARNVAAARAVRLVSSALPAAAVAALAWAVSLGSDLPERAGITALALVQAAALLRLTLAWSLAPLSSGARTPLVRTPAGHGT